MLFQKHRQVRVVGTGDHFTVQGSFYFQTPVRYFFELDTGLCVIIYGVFIKLVKCHGSWTVVLLHRTRSIY